MASILRLSAQKAPLAFSRSFSVSAAKKDLVQDLYVNQLKSYKPAAKSADAHKGAVRSFTAPQAPTAPSLPTDLASELSKFDAEEPALGATAKKASTTSEASEGVEEYLAFLEKDLPKAEAHH
ncbi:hypothetical protein IAR50_006501 [Cryptococcus sp. DSM 104548]